MSSDRPESRLAQAWYRDALWLWVLRPLAWLFALLTGLRRLFYRRGWLSRYRSPVPLVVVGNITVGGAGKTPITLALIERLQQHGVSVGVVSRGYGATPPSYPWQVRLGDCACEVGDEPLLIHRLTSVPVVIDPDRTRAVRYLENLGVDLIISDDGLQHYRLARDIELCVVDGQRHFGNRQLLPAGPLREPLSRLREVDAILVNGGEALSSLAPSWSFTLEPSHWYHLQSAQHHSLDSGCIPAQPDLAIAGIGNPTRFFQTLARLQIQPQQCLALADHAPVSEAQGASWQELTVMMTEKDAIKWRAEQAGAQWWALAVRARLPESFYTHLLTQLTSLGVSVDAE